MLARISDQGPPKLAHHRPQSPGRRGLDTRDWRGFGHVLGRDRELLAPLKGETF